MKNRWLIVVSLCFALSPFLSKGQLVEYGLHIDNKIIKNQSVKTLQEPLDLPFWDDFYATYGIPNDSLWVDSEDILINNYYAYEPPSLGTATFDGLKADGTPFNSDPESSEKIDRLTSHPIDLSGYTSADNIVLSFFYQFGGYGEMPDFIDEDKLQIEFKNTDGEWVPVMEILPREDLNSEAFYQVLIDLDDQVYFYDNFQFAFQVFGNQAGPYDVWNVDYVYLNSGRDDNDIYFPDRAVSQQLSNIFNEYTAIPRTHIDFSQDLKTPYFLLNNLYDNFQTYRQTATITVETLEETVETEYSLTAEGTGSPIFKDEIDTVYVPFPIMENLPEEDSLIHQISYEISVKTYDNRLDSGNYDIKYDPIDFRINDTVRQTYNLADYYAYDDGTAEGAAGLQVAGNVFAYKFHLKNVDSSYIHGIDINTVYAGESANGKSIKLHVWNNGGGKPGQQLSKDDVYISGDDLRNSFSRYELRKPVLVKDTFYIGFTLNSSGRFPIGLDKNSDNANKIMENVQGAWSPLGDRITGTFMIRPFVGPAPTGPVTSVDEPENLPGLVLYPNPSRDGNFFINREVEDILVSNISGQQIKANFSSSFGTTQFQIKGKGVFVVKIISNDRVYLKKVIVR